MEEKKDFSIFTNTRNSILKFVNIDGEGQLTLKKEVLQEIEGNEEIEKYLQSVIKTIPNTDDPNAIAMFNYHYKDGKLCNIDTDKPFHWVNQTHYDALGDTIVRHIQDLLVNETNLIELYLPLDDPEKVYSKITEYSTATATATTATTATATTATDATATDATATDTVTATATDTTPKPPPASEQPSSEPEPNTNEDPQPMQISPTEEQTQPQTENPQEQSTSIPRVVFTQPTTPFNNIFVSSNVYDCSTLLLLIQGSGAVRAGQWARALCINENLDLGTILPYVKKAQELQWGIVVFNPNLNELPVHPPPIHRKDFLTMDKLIKPRPDVKKISGSENYINHGEYVWKHFVEKSRAEKIAIVAHSRGGDNTVQLLKKYKSQFFSRVAGVAFTDSVHYVDRYDPQFVVDFLRDRCCNWVTSMKPLNAYVSAPQHDCLRVSAGHNQHEYTSGTSISAVFPFLLDKLQNFQPPKPHI
eukprot:TRINITY_DN3262_c0_g1_i1.p1 TRINITY_DN3262_c0_g1~~TRINITY_DN3262_c0_g1_i1.p1  ORF type:complete len:474 (-),score=94.87 TRINITY_DN3262_c0_g1_i1:34-1455(-)